MCFFLGTRPQLQDDALNDTLSSFIYIRPRSPRKFPLVAAQKSPQLLSSHYSATRLNAAVNPNILIRSNIVRTVTGEIGINIGMVGKTYVQKGLKVKKKKFLKIIRKS